MSVKKPRIAVVIPTYNRADILSRAIGSILKSPRQDFELAVIDDASTDETMDVLGDYTDPRLIVRRLPQHANGNAARNEGIRATTAPVIAFLDSDDEFLDGRVERLADQFESHPEVGVVVDSFHAEHRGIRHLENVPARTVSRETLEHLVVTHAIPLTTSAISVRRDVLDSIGGFDTSIVRMQDKDLLLRLAPATSIVLGTGDDVIKHRTQRSVSRGMSGYVKGLDDLAGKHAIFQRPEYRDVLAYLAVRPIIKCILSGQLDHAARETGALLRAGNIPVSLPQAVARYMRWKRARRHTREQAMT